MMGPDALLARAEELDRADPLARWRDEFHIPDPELAYLDGNSLGMPPRRTLDRVATMMREEWGGELINGWDHWLDMPQRVGDMLAPLIGAKPGEVVLHDSVTVNVYQLVRAALLLRPERRAIAIDPGDFPTDRYVVEGIAAADGREVRAGFDRLDDVAVVLRSMIDYRTAEVVDIAAETARMNDAGALVRNPNASQHSSPNRPSAIDLARTLSIPASTVTSIPHCAPVKATMLGVPNRSRPMSSRGV
jgi:kynureninase